MHLMPVSKGVLTLSLVMTPGAILSMGRVLLVLIGPKSSIGVPKEETTLPSKASPTGTSATLFVRLTVSPSLMRALSPKRTAPTLSRLRFMTMPMTSCGKRSNSPSIALLSPKMMAMPSPTLVTVPTSSFSIAPSKDLICSLIRALISSVAIFMLLSSFITL